MKAVVALGGNALLQKGEPMDIEHQYKNALRSVRAIASLVADGYKIAVTHGNGPQVGVTFFRNVYTSDKYPPYPLDALNAETQGWIGYLLCRAMRNVFGEIGLKNRAVAVVTQVLVDANDPAFQNPSKPIGNFFTKEEAEELMAKYGWKMIDDAGRGWRVVVPSPWPIKIVEGDIVRELVDEGTIVVAAGGGGIPVVEENGKLKGVEAVIDKDRASAVLAKEIGAELLIILTQIDVVYLNFGKPNAEPISRMTVSEAKEYLGEGHFAAGSMGPKVEAAIRFIEDGGKKVIITSLELAHEALEGKAGTVIIPD